MVVTRTHRATQATHQSLDSISFAMEDMARNIRLGTAFECGGNTALDPNCVSTVNQYDAVGKKLTFESFNGDISNVNDNFSYWIAPLGASSTYSLFKSITGDSGSSMDSRYVAITGPTVEIDPALSGFTVLGAYPSFAVAGGHTDNEQVHVLIRLAGSIHYQDTTVPFDIQTTITPRQPDL